MALLLAGVVSYAASREPRRARRRDATGCQRGEVDRQEPLEGQCIAQHAGEHATAGSPLADYTVGGDSGALTGVAGVIGVLVTLLVAGGAVLAPAPPHAGDPPRRAGWSDGQPS